MLPHHLICIRQLKEISASLRILDAQMKKTQGKWDVSLPGHSWLERIVLGSQFQQRPWAHFPLSDPISSWTNTSFQYSVHTTHRSFCLAPPHQAVSWSFTTVSSTTNSTVVDNKTSKAMIRVAEQSRECCDHFTLLWNTGVGWKPSEEGWGRPRKGRQRQEDRESPVEKSRCSGSRWCKGLVCRSGEKRRRDLQSTFQQILSLDHTTGSEFTPMTLLHRFGEESSPCPTTGCTPIS